MQPRRSLAMLRPERLVVLDDLTAHERAGLRGELCGSRALEADEHVPRRPRVLDARRGQRLEHQRIGRRGDDGARRGGQRMKAHADPLDRTQPPFGADDEPGQVVAGDVLDDPAAPVHHGAIGQPHSDAQKQVAGRSVPVRTGAGHRSREGGGDASPLGVRRVEGQHLAVRGQPPPQLAQRDGAVDDGGQIAGLVLDQKRSDTPSSSRGWRRYGPGTSPHSRGVGSSFPGLQSPSGSNARAGGPSPRGRPQRTSRHRARLVDADAVLAGERPARVDARVQDLGRDRSARSPRPRPRRRRGRAGAGCRRRRGTRSPTRRPDSSPSASIRRSTSGARARHDAVLDVVVGEIRPIAANAALRPCQSARPLGVVGGDPHLGGAAVARRSARPRPSRSTSAAGPVELEDQHGAGAGG